MSKVLFFNPPWREYVYNNTNIKTGAPSYPNLTLATLAGSIDKHHEVEIIDLDIINNYYDSLFIKIREFKPDLIAASAKTPEYPIVEEIMTLIKKNYPQVRTIIGGVHATTRPYDLVEKECFDIVAIGEGDNVINEILSEQSIDDVKGLFFKNKISNKIVYTGNRSLIENINLLPFPNWKLFDLSKYKNSRLSSRQNPVGHIETSRGCSFHCNFCNKLTFGTVYREKKPKRVVDEMEYMLSCGFKEIHIADDSFTQNIQRAKEICKEIISRKLIFSWSLINGIRVDKIDKEFLLLAKKAGCWQIGLGIESGDQNILNTINKKTSLRQIINAVNLIKESKIESFGFFIFGLSGETEETMKKTISFAKKLPLDTAKFDICIPYPGTQYYEELDANNLIISHNWQDYSVHQITNQIFSHPNLSWDNIVYYYKRGYREFYFRPLYILKRFIRDIKMGDILYEIKYLLTSRW